jgi:hypothetical protein
MNTKIKALALLSVVVVAAVAGVFIFTVESAVKADTTNAVASDIESTSTLSVTNATDNGAYSFNGPMMMGEGFDGGHRGMVRGFGEFGGGALQVSADFTANVTNIVKSDSDVQNLLNQGFNITSIRPIITTTIDGNGNIVTKASTANVLLRGNNGSKSFVVVDLTQAKATKIVTLTVTEIDK